MPKRTFLNLPEEKRQRIIDEALSEFARYPYHQASLSRIVRRAGIAKGSVYQYFEDKFDLYMHLLELTAEAKLKYIDRELDRLPGSAGLFEKLVASIRGGLQMAAERPELLQLGDRLLAESEEFLHAVMARFADLSGSTIVSWIIEGQAAGTLDRRISPATAAYVVQTVMVGMSRDMAAGRIPRDGAMAMIREVLGVLEHGMRPREREEEEERQE